MSGLGSGGRQAHETRMGSRRAIAGCLAADAAEQALCHARSAIVCVRVGRRRSNASVAANRSIWTALLRRLPRRRKGTPLTGVKSNRIPRLPLRKGSRESERAAYLQKRDLRGRLALKPAP
jgi:hypothetical protein